MNRVYLLNLDLNNASFTVYGKGGNGMIYNFVNGNVTLKVPAYFMTEDPYKQQLLEESDIFKQGKVIFDKETAKAVAAENAAKAMQAQHLAAAKAYEEQQAVLEDEEPDTDEAQDVKIEAGIVSVTEAVAYVLEHFNETVRSAAQAKAVAEKNGVLFPNLKVGKGKK